LIIIRFKAGSVLLAHRQVIVQPFAHAFIIRLLVLLQLFFQTLSMIQFLGTLQGQQFVATGIEIPQHATIQGEQRDRHLFHGFHLRLELAQELLTLDVAIAGITEGTDALTRLLFCYEFLGDSQGVFHVGLFDAGVLGLGFLDDLFLIQPCSDPIDYLLIEGVDIELLIGVCGGHDRLLEVDGAST